MCMSPKYVKELLFLNKADQNKEHNNSSTSHNKLTIKMNNPYGISSGVMHCSPQAFLDQGHGEFVSTLFAATSFFVGVIIIIVNYKVDNLYPHSKTHNLHYDETQYIFLPAH